MISIVQTELLKFRRQKMLFGIAGILILFWVGMTFWTYHIPRTDSQMDSFIDFYTRYGNYMSMFLACLIGLLFIKSLSEEYRSDTLKEILQVPISKYSLFSAKVVFVLVMSVIIMLMNCVLVVIGAVICNFPDVTVLNIINLIRYFLLIAITLPFSMFPVYFVAVLSKGSTVFSATFNFLYVLAGAIGLNQFIGIHPISSLFNILFNKQISFEISSKKQFLCVGNIIVVAAIIGFLVAVYYASKRGREN